MMRLSVHETIDVDANTTELKDTVPAVLLNPVPTTETVVPPVVLPVIGVMEVIVGALYPTYTVLLVNDETVKMTA
jgi:hypothetical protein